MLNYDFFKKLARDGVLGGPVLVNAGRGGLQIEKDILRALDDGTLVGASLDVFEQEPLPQASTLWSHPKIYVTPHNAAQSDPEALTKYVLDQIADFERGKPLRNVIDRKIGY
jgi:glyoxylate/hydroxypyruvate reductase